MEGSVSFRDFDCAEMKSIIESAAESGGGEGSGGGGGGGGVGEGGGGLKINSGTVRNNKSVEDFCLAHQR